MLNIACESLISHFERVVLQKCGSLFIEKRFCDSLLQCCQYPVEIKLLSTGKLELSVTRHDFQKQEIDVNNGFPELPKLNLEVKKTSLTM